MTIALSTFTSASLIIENPSYAAMNEECTEDISPSLTFADTDFNAKLITGGLKKPSSIAFIDDKLVVLELVNGTVRMIRNGVLETVPLLDLSIAKVEGERGLLGIAYSHNKNGAKYVFLYYTEAEKDGGKAIGNRLYRYVFDGDKLVNPKLLIDLPTEPGPYHNGGSMAIGPDDNVYISIGDLTDLAVQKAFSKTQNIPNGTEPNGSGGILRVTQDGDVVNNTVLGEGYPLNLYFAYGIRNSFGIAFDPLTGKLWDTENGPNYGDEINFVESGFNSGWQKVQGIWKDKGGRMGKSTSNDLPPLVDFNSKGKYSKPEFTWNKTVGPTALLFFNSSNFGKEYLNDLFVGDVHNGTLYHFDLNKKRNALNLDDNLRDRIANNYMELKNVAFATGFEGGITDLAIGPDGDLYLVSGIWGCDGKIYRISHKLDPKEDMTGLYK